MKIYPFLFLVLPLALAVSADGAELAPARALPGKKGYPAAIAALEAITAAEPKDAEAQLVPGNALSGRIGEVGLVGARRGWRSAR